MKANRCWRWFFWLQWFGQGRLGDKLAGHVCVVAMQLGTALHRIVDRTLRPSSALGTHAARHPDIQTRNKEDEEDEDEDEDAAHKTFAARRPAPVHPLGQPPSREVPASSHRQKHPPAA